MWLTRMDSFTPEYLAQSTTGALQIILSLVIALPLTFLCLRCYVRIRIKRVFGLDDTVAVVAMLVLVGYAGVLLAATQRGLGRHVQYIEDHGSLRDVSLLAQIAQTLAIVACTLGKTAFAITLTRIFVQAWALRILWFVIVTMNLVNFLCAIFVFVQCQDPRVLWDTDVRSVCWPSYVFTDFSLFVGSYSAAQDFLLVLLPCFIILKLNMKRMEKLAIILSMSLGIFAGIAAVVKCTYLVTLSNQTDRFYSLPPLFIWAAAEDALAIIAATIPTLRPLVATKSPGSSNTYPLRIFDKADDSLYPNLYRAELSTVIEAGPATHVRRNSENLDATSVPHSVDYLRDSGNTQGFERLHHSTLKGHILATTQVEMTYERGQR